MNNKVIGEITDFENQIFEFKYLTSEMFFKNDRSIVQECNIFPNAKLVCDWCRKENDYDIQVVFPLTANWNYNTYLIFIYSWKTSILYILGYRSHTVYPPVWDRAFSPGPDYIDFIKIQNYINKFLKSKELPEFLKDDELKGRSWNASTNTPEEIQQLIKDGKPYNIISLKAEAADKLKLLDNFLKSV